MPTHYEERIWMHTSRKLADWWLFHAYQNLLVVKQLHNLLLILYPVCLKRCFEVFSLCFPCNAVMPVFNADYTGSASVLWKIPYELELSKIRCLLMFPCSFIQDKRHYLQKRESLVRNTIILCGIRNSGCNRKQTHALGKTDFSSIDGPQQCKNFLPLPLGLDCVCSRFLNIDGMFYSIKDTVLFLTLTQIREFLVKRGRATFSGSVVST